MNAPSTYSATKSYMEANATVDPGHIEESLDRLSAIKTAQVGIITLAEDLDIETVTEIFIRINSKGVALSSADFAMSKIASHGLQGSNLRKLIDYFCHLSVAPHVYEDITKNDKGFAASGYLERIAWLRHDSSDLYDPTYTDMIRVAGIRGFGRGKVSAVVSFLSGRDFETRRFDESIAVQSFDRLESVLLEVVNQYNFQQFTMTIKSAGFTNARLISSKNALNFAYALYLQLRNEKGLNEGQIKRTVRKWFVMSVLTGRYTGSIETAFEADIRRVAELGEISVLDSIEKSSLSDNYWEVALPMSMNTSSARSPYFLAFLAAQVHNNARGFLSKNITVANMIDESGDVHHLVPKNHLIGNNIVDRSEYNQIANYALTETPINIAIKDLSPEIYMKRVDSRVLTGELIFGEIADNDDLGANLEENAVPDSLRSTTAANYAEFLEARRQEMAAYIRRYYERL